MSNEVTKKATTDLDDGFGGFTRETQGQDLQDSGLLQGGRIKFTLDYKYTVNGVELPKDIQLIVAKVVRATLKWFPDKTMRPDVRVLGPNEPFPDIKAINAAASPDEMIEGLDGKPTGPYQKQFVLYLIGTTAAMERYTFATSTVGGEIAIDDLTRLINWMRSFKGAKVYAVINLRDVFMPTQFGGRQRPHFPAVRWITFDDGNGEPALLDDKTPPLAGSVAEKPAAVADTLATRHLSGIGMKTVEKPTAKEVTKDEIPW